MTKLVKFADYVSANAFNLANKTIYYCGAIFLSGVATIAILKGGLVLSLVGVLLLVLTLTLVISNAK